MAKRREKRAGPQGEEWAGPPELCSKPEWEALRAARQPDRAHDSPERSTGCVQEPLCFSSAARRLPGRVWVPLGDGSLTSELFWGTRWTWAPPSLGASRTPGERSGQPRGRSRTLGGGWGGAGPPVITQLPACSLNGLPTKQQQIQNMVDRRPGE